MAPMVLLLLLLLLWPQGCVSGPPVDVYTRVQHREGETLSVQCSYKGRKNRVDGKVWCKIRRKKCEPGFTRLWVKGPRYLLQDDARARVVNITMHALKQQDSGRYWCMRNSSGMLYPMMGIQLEVSPASTTERSIPLTRLDHVLQSSDVAPMTQAPTSDPRASLTSGVTVLTSGRLTVTGLPPSSVAQTTRPSSETGHGSSDGSITTVGPWRAMGSRTVMTTAPSSTREWYSPASQALLPTKPRRLSTSLPTTVKCQNRLPSLRQQDLHVTVLVVALTFLPAPMMLIVVYGFWKKRHMGSYSICRNPARPWRAPSRRPELLQKLAWLENT